jgi:hypothetical protein
MQHHIHTLINIRKRESTFNINNRKQTEPRFLVVEPNYPDSNLRFDVSVAYLRLIIILVVDDIPVDSEAPFDRLRESQDHLLEVLIGIGCAYVYSQE